MLSINSEISMGMFAQTSLSLVFEYEFMQLQYHIKPIVTFNKHVHFNFFFLIILLSIDILKKSLP